KSRDKSWAKPPPTVYWHEHHNRQGGRHEPLPASHLFEQSLLFDGLFGDFGFSALAISYWVIHRLIFAFYILLQIKAPTARWYLAGLGAINSFTLLGVAISFRVITAGVI